MGALRPRSRPSGRDQNRRARANAFVNGVVDEEGDLVRERAKARVQRQADTEDPAKFAMIGLAFAHGPECRIHAGDFLGSSSRLTRQWHGRRARPALSEAQSNRCMAHVTQPAWLAPHTVTGRP